MEPAPKFRCHEFHYARIEREVGVPLFRDLEAGIDQTYGLTAGSVSGSFMHIVDQAGEAVA